MKLQLLVEDEFDDLIGDEPVQAGEDHFSDKYIAEDILQWMDHLNASPSKNRFDNLEEKIVDDNDNDISYKIWRHPYVRGIEYNKDQGIVAILMQDGVWCVASSVYHHPGDWYIEDVSFV
jgi:hypothetical protein